MKIQEETKQLDRITAPVAGIIQDFVTATKRLLREQLIAEYLFGSYATNTQTPESDIDILIIVKECTPELQWQLSGLAVDYALQYDVCISPILKDIHVWNKNKTYHTLFYHNVMTQGIPL